MTIYKDLLGAAPLPPMADAAALVAKYPTFAAYPDGVKAVLLETYQALRETPAKLSLALTVIKSALIAFGRGDGEGYEIKEMSLKLFADHVRQIMRNDL
jgi:hypothetical protein